MSSTQKGHLPILTALDLCAEVYAADEYGEFGREMRAVLRRLHCSLTEALVFQRDGDEEQKKFAAFALRVREADIEKARKYEEELKEARHE